MFALFLFNCDSFPGCFRSCYLVCVSSVSCCVPCCVPCRVLLPCCVSQQVVLVVLAPIQLQSYYYFLSFFKINHINFSSVWESCLSGSSVATQLPVTPMGWAGRRREPKVDLGHGPSESVIRIFLWKWFIKEPMSPSGRSGSGSEPLRLIRSLNFRHYNCCLL